MRAVKDELYTAESAAAVSIGFDALDRLISVGSGAAALLYLYCLRAGGPVTAEDASAALGFTRNETAAAAERLREAGLLRGKPEDRDRNAAGNCSARPKTAVHVPEPADSTPEYTAADIKLILERGGDFSALVREVQKSLGKVLSSDDLIKLFGIYDGLGMPSEVILQLVTYCIGEQQRRYGPDRLPTMRYIEKAAYTWDRAGVLTLDLAEKYIRDQETRRSAVSEMKTVLGIRDRELSPSERKYVENWIAMGFGPEAASVALDRTLLKTNKLTWPYMDSILKSWDSKGIHTPEEIERGDPRPAPGKPSSGRRRQDRSAAPTEAELKDILDLINDMKEDR